MKQLMKLLPFLLVLTPPTWAYRFSGPKWSGLNPVVKYYLNEEGTPDVADEFDFLHRSFDTWCKTPGTAISSQYIGPTAVNKQSPDSKNILTFQKGLEWPFDHRVIAVCYTWFGGSAGGQMYYSNFDIIFNNKDFRWATDGSPGKMDVGHIATHEIGHALGIAHSEVSSAVMWPYASRGDTTNRALSTDDSIAITTLYPRTVANNQPPVITSKPVTEAIAGEKYTYQVTAIDKDDDTIRYSLVANPLNMKIDSVTGLIYWYPKFLDIGAHTVTVAAKDPMGGVAKQTWKINVSDIVVYTSDTTARAGDTLLYPVLVTQMDDYGIVAGNIELRFNKVEMSVAGVDTTGTVLRGVTLFSNISNDTVKVAFAGSKPFAGKGALFNIRLVVPPAMCGMPVSIRLVKAFFNDGDPVANTRDGSIFTPCGGCGGGGYSIEGSVVYSGNGKGVGGAKLTLRELNKSTLSDSTGSWVLSSIPRSSVPYTVAAAKDSGDVRDAVSAYDASLILRSIVGLVTLNSFRQQRACADVNVNDMITAYDAALILRYIVGIDDQSKIGNWVMIPETTTVPQLIMSVKLPPIEAYMVGDVSGNWGKSCLPKRALDAAPAFVLDEFRPAQVSGGSGTISVQRTTISVENAGRATYSGEIEIALNSAGATIHSIRSLPMLEGYISEANMVGDRIRIAFAGTRPLALSGGLFEVEVVAAAGSTEAAPLSGTMITFNRLNETRALVRGAYASDVARPSTGALDAHRASFELRSESFTGRISVRYTLTESQRVTAVLYDMQGREAARLLDGVEGSGQHQLTWNGARDGRSLGSRMYVLRFVCRDFARSVKVNGF